MDLLLCCVQEKQKQVRSRESGSKASASRGSTEAQDMKFLQQFAASRTDMADLAAALTEATRQPSRDEPQSRSDPSGPALQENAPSSTEQAPTPLTRDGAVEALADRCKQAIGLTEAQVCTSCHHVAHLRRPDCGGDVDSRHILSCPTSIFCLARLWLKRNLSSVNFPANGLVIMTFCSSLFQWLNIVSLFRLLRFGRGQGPTGCAGLRR